jgi:hypothetical protein
MIMHALALALATLPAAALEVTVHHPAASTWKRTQCGSPSGKHGPIPAVPAVPAGKPWTLEMGMDCGSGDMAPCGSAGCHNKTMTAADCEAMCKGTKGCVAYVFAAQSCNSGTAICWQKSSCVPKHVSNCRAVAQAKGSLARPAQPAKPAGPGADIPSKYALNVSAGEKLTVNYCFPGR